MNNITVKIKNMIKDNEKELNRTLEELEFLQKDYKKVSQSQLVTEELMLQAKKMLILKDKVLVHKTAVKVLNQVLENIK